MHNRAPAPFIFDDLECAPQGYPLSLLTAFAASSPKGTPLGCAGNFIATAKSRPLGEGGLPRSGKTEGVLPEGVIFKVIRQLFLRFFLKSRFDG